MVQEDIVAQGIELMLYGMGTVVVFLALLVLITTGMSALIQRFFPVADAPQVAAVDPGPVASQPAGLNNELVAAITAAIHQHRAATRDTADD